MLRKQEIKGKLALVAMLLPTALAIPAAQATSLVSPAKVNGICRTNYSAAKAWSHRVPVIESDEAMAAWEVGVAKWFGWTGGDLRVVGARTLGTHFGRVAAAHRTAAKAYLSGSLTRVNGANAQLRTVSTRAMNVARSQRATVCVAFIKDFRP